MYTAAQASATTAHTPLHGRDLEASILLKAAAKLQAVKDNWDTRSGEVDSVLTYNRKLWTVLAASVSSKDNPLPAPVKQNIINLSVFIFNHSLRLITEPAAERLGVLINISREIAGGLMTRAAAAAPAQS